jgi:hypothetical protein
VDFFSLKEYNSTKDFMTIEGDVITDNLKEEKPDRFGYEFEVKKDPNNRGWLKIEAQITLENGEIETYTDSGKNEFAMMSRFQERLAQYGSRKSDQEESDIYNEVVPAGEIRDSITPHDLLELR